MNKISVALLASGASTTRGSLRFTSGRSATRRGAAFAFFACSISVCLVAGAKAQVVETVVVTAEKRETVLEKTPATINVIPSEFIDARGGAVELRELTAAAPSLVVTDGVAGLVGVSLRGVGTSSSNQLFEQSIGLFIDGVYYPKSIQYRSGMLDAERIEVIKGSQGVLYGENTSVGAISIISKQPGDVFGGYVQGHYETSFGSWETNGVVDVPVSDQLSVRLAGSYSDAGGYVHDDFQNTHVPTERRYVTRAVARWQPTSSLDVTLKIQHSEVKTRGDGYQITDLGNPATVAAYGDDIAGDRPFETATGYLACGFSCGQIFGPSHPIDYTRSFAPTGTAIRSNDVALNANYNLPNGLTLTSVTGYEQFNYFNAFDSDQSPAPIFEQQFRESFQQGTEELRVTSPTGGRLEYLAGLFFLTQRDNFTYRDFIQHLLLFGPFGPDISGVTQGDTPTHTESASLFGQATYHLTPALAATAGIRLSTETRKGSFTGHVDDLGNPSNFIHVFAPYGPASFGRIHNDTIDLSANLSYQAADDLLLYASWARGQKAGAFNNAPASFTPAPAPFTLKAQETTSYEVGAKLKFLDGAGYLGVAAYYLDIKDFQDSFYNAAAFAFQVRSIDATSEGLELETNIALADWVSIWGSANYNDAYLANHEPMQRAPRYTASLGGRFHWSPDQRFALFLEPMVSYSSKFYTQGITATGNNVAVQHAILDTGIGIDLSDSGIELALMGENLTNARYKVMSFGSFEGLGTLGLYNRPRTFTLSLRIPFGHN